MVLGDSFFSEISSIKSSILIIFGDKAAPFIDLIISFFKNVLDLRLGIIKKVLSRVTRDKTSLTTDSKNVFISLKIKKAPNYRRFYLSIY